MKAFSVCIPAHKNDLRLFNTISSVLSQDYPRDLFEICVYFNGREAPTATELRVDRVEHTPKLLGPALAKNFALDMGKESGIGWLVLLDSDDFLIPSALMMYNKTLDKHPDLMVGAEFGCINILRTPEAIGAFYHRTEAEFLAFWENNFPFVKKTGAVGRPILFSRNAPVNFNPQYSFAEEREFAVACWRRKINIHLMRTCSYVYNWNEDGVTKGKTVKESMEFKKVVDHISDLAELVTAKYTITDDIMLVPVKERVELIRWAMLEKYLDRRNV